MAEIEQKTRLSRAKSSWLESHSSDWVSQGLIDESSRTRILDSYQIEPAERRGLLALMLLGALMFGIGVLLLIGYNWARLPVPGKIAIIMSSVAVAFAASAVAFAKRHRVAGETIAFIGVFLFGNAIWLIAQVLHIRGNFSDAFMWWAIGALVAAWLVRSRVIGAGSAVLVLIWVVAAGFTFDRPVLSFVAVWMAALAVVYRLESQLMLVPAALSPIAWVCCVPSQTQPVYVSVGVAALASCAFYGVGACHRSSNRLGRVWQFTALAALVASLVPLLTTGFHKIEYQRQVTWASLIVALPLLLTAIFIGVRWARGPIDLEARGPRRSLADAVVLTTALVVSVWLGLLASGFATDSGWVYGSTFGFSLLALGLSISFIRKALDSDSALDLTFGVLFALAFLLVRWASLIDSMLWSGVMLLVASAGFFAIARLWGGRTRRHPRVLAPVPTGVAR